jgi:pyruvate dehydrogenase E2 component (dihydrolipoamide acetyltransferase)
VAEVNMPKLSDTMEEGTVISWKVQDGQDVKKGDVIAEVESDKASFEINAEADGPFHIVVEEGKAVPVGSVIANIGGEARGKQPATEPKAEEPKQTHPKPDQAQETEPPQAREEETPAEQPAQEEQPPRAEPERQEQRPAAEGDGAGRLRVSPIAARLAAERGVDLRTIKGSGPEGRIVKDDVLAAAKGSGGGATPAAASSRQRTGPDVEREELSRLQTIIARRMTQSKTEVPHFYVTVEIRMDEAFRLQKQLRETVRGAEKVSVADMLVKAAALALRKHPTVNASWAGDHIEVKRRVNIGYAVAGPRALIVPVLKDADEKDLVQISSERRALVERAQAGKPTPQDLEGGTFSISNLGTYGVDEFAAIVNQPESVIIAIGATKDAAVVEDGQVVVRKVMRVTGSADHRVVYGADLAEFLATIRSLLESPVTLVLPPGE